ncbi:MAG: hypothetical protein EA426_13865 [Spirochaetaceae bacterium]|nr:MAG: hypothetical protein EA426_13865 [Spirochaetaceae bacterium]
MGLLPDYIGTGAFGLRLGVITPGCDLCGMVTDVIERCARDRLLDDGDIVCVTESVLARTQGNFVSVEQVSAEVRSKLGAGECSSIGVVFPILSRNRFSMILEGIAGAVPNGRVVLQLSFPTDEVGNELIPREFVATCTPNSDGVIASRELQGKTFLHPITKVDYIRLYREIIEAAGAVAEIVLCNDPSYLARRSSAGNGLTGVIAADIHTREATAAALRDAGARCITLADLCCEGERSSEWGLLGSNMSSGRRLKLAPKDAAGFARTVHESIRAKTGADVEVIVYGDGAYKDPTTGIFELADPMPVFGSTEGIVGRMREGVKYKLIADTAIGEGKSAREVEAIIERQKKDRRAQGHIENEGTTPRRMGDLIASLADLVSGSADAGTPVVLAKGFLSP